MLCLLRLSRCLCTFLEVLSVFVQDILTEVLSLFSGMQMQGMHKAELGLHKQDAPAGCAQGSKEDISATPPALAAGGCAGADLDGSRKSCAEEVAPVAAGTGAAATVKPLKEKRKGKKKEGHRRRVNGRMIGT